MRDSELSMRSRVTVGAFVSGLSWEDVPVSTRKMAKQCMLDTVGAMLVGTRTKAAAIAAEFTEAWWPRGEATVVASGHRSSAAGAAFANGAAANGTDIDDCGIYTWGHPGAQVLVTTLAVSEEQHLPGSALLTGLVVGYELAFRASRCVHDHTDIYRACGSWGALACAGVASNLYGLSAVEASTAIGIADYNSPYLPMMRDIDHPSMAKHGIGWGAMTGIMAGDLAKRGFTGPPSILEFDEYEPWVAGLGQELLLDHGVIWKEFSCCAWAHPALEAVRQLQDKQLIPLEHIKRIVVQTYEEGCRLDIHAPKTTEEAQFSLPWSLAVMLVDGQLGPDGVLDARLSDSLTRRLASMVELVPSAEFTALHALIEDHDPDGADPASVTIELDDGRRILSGRVDYPLVRWSLDDIETKFRRTTTDVLSADRTEEIVAMVREFETIDDVRELTSTISPPSR